MFIQLTMSLPSVRWLKSLNTYGFIWEDTCLQLRRRHEKYACRQFVFDFLLAGSGWPALTVVQTGGARVWVINSQPALSSPPQTKLSSVWVGNSLSFSLGQHRVCSRTLLPGSARRTSRSRAELLLCLTNRSENYCTWEFENRISRAHLQPRMISHCRATMRELGGRQGSFPNMAPRQNQLWFPVTSLEQHVHVGHHEPQGGRGDKAQQEESETLLALQGLMTLC